MMRRVLLLTALVAALVPAFTAGTAMAAPDILLGNGSVAGLADSNAPGLAEAFSFRASGAGSASSISVYVDGGSSATRMIVGLYADAAGHPGTLLASGSDSAPTAGRWDQVTLESAATLSSATTYWLAVLGTGGQLNFRDAVGAAGCSESSAQSDLTGLASSWTSGTTWASCSVSAYVTGTAAPATPPPPANTAPPTISGKAVQGQTLTASTGSWSGAPTSFAYQWQDCATSCTDISGATNANYVLSSGDVGDTLDVVVTASNAAGRSSAASAPTSFVTAADVVAGGGSSSPGVPAGVTLRAVDGGAGYYCAHGFTYACEGGWDDPSFFPIGPWWGGFDRGTWSDVGWNTAFRTTSDLAAMNAAGVFSIVGSNGDSSGGLEDSPLLARTVGLLANDEPNCWSDPNCGNNGPVTPALASTPNSVQDGRFWYVNSTWNLLRFGPPQGTPGAASADLFTDPVATPDGSARHLDIGSLDEYWFSEANNDPYSSRYEGGVLYGVNPDGNGLSNAQAQCGCRYGDVIDSVPGTSIGLDPDGKGTSAVFEREIQDPASPQGNPSSVPAPIPTVVEDGNAGGPGAVSITPPQMNWAVWSSIIHGARQLIYFDHSFGGDCQGDDNIKDPCYQSPYGGQSVSIYAQVKATDSLIKQVATDINSPVALGYVTVAGAAGSLNGPPATFSGIETRATYNQAAGHFTIFADTRDPEASTPGPVTFHTADSYSGPVTVLCDSRTGADGHLNPGSCANRTVTASNGTFTDTFAHGSTVHIYQIP